jgi:hypothetical protein
MKTKSCVVFAISIDHGDMLYVLHEFVMLLKYRFSDCKIFVGINYNSHPDVEVILNQSGLDIVMDRLTDSYLHTASDDSAYQLSPIKFVIALGNSGQKEKRAIIKYQRAFIILIVLIRQVVFISP